MVEKMDEFERELREQLQARSAPGGFADRVMARVPHGRAPRETFLGLGLPMWRWAVAAVLLALRITGSTLRDVQQKVSARDERESFSQKGTVREHNDQ